MTQGDLLVESEQYEVMEIASVGKIEEVSRMERKRDQSREKSRQRSKERSGSALRK